MATIAVTGRADLTDTQWAVLEPLLPKGKKSGRPPKWTKRQLIDGIRWRVRMGSQWRDLPPRYGPWQTVYGLFRRWQRDGSWWRILTGLQARADAAGLITWDVSVDSTIARAHQHAAGARKRGTCKRSHPAGSMSNQPITRWVARGVGGPRSCSWAVSRAASRWRSWSPLVSAGQPAVRRRDRANPGAQTGGGPPTDPTRSGPGRQGVQLKGQPNLPAPTRDQGDYPDQG